MGLTPRCPQCQKPNALDAGGQTVCSKCGTRYEVLIDPGGGTGVASPAPGTWAPHQPPVFLGYRLTPRFYTVTGGLLVLLFVGVWLLLHAIANHQVANLNRLTAAARLPKSSNDSSADSGDSATPTTPPPQVVLPPVTPPTPGPPPPAVVTTAPAPAPATIPTRPPAGPVHEDDEALTDAQIGKALKLACDYLLANMDPATGELRKQTGVVGPDGSNPAGYQHGMNALCVYAMLQCGGAMSDPRLSPRAPPLRACIEAMKVAPDDPGHTTYQRALRSAALSLINRDEDRPVLSADLAWLLKAQHEGAYDYNLLSGGSSWDNSNSQYGLLGVWSAAEADLQVPASYWSAVERHWADNQDENGTWSYRSRGSGGTPSMTMAGVTSLFVTRDYLQQERRALHLGGDPFPTALQNALTWLETGDNGVNNNTRWAGYALYSVARAGLASGFKYFGAHDWYTELAQKAVHTQDPEGSWSHSPIETSFCLLFLARGRHPVLMNKARFDGYWANYPRDAANLARFAGHALERPFNWQVVSLAHNWTDWTDCPILYLASHKPPTLAARDLDNLRAFVRAGGLLFTHADGNSDAFNAFARDLAHRLFPEYPLADLPADHPLYTSVFKLNPRPPLQAASNGARLLMVHSPEDVAQGWQIHDWRSNLPAYRLGMDLFIYAAGRRDFRNRLDTVYVTPPKKSPTYVFRVARVKCGGNWNPEPYAWTRFAHRLQWQTGYGVETIPVQARDLLPATAPFAHLTNTSGFDVSPDVALALRKYVEGGGVLMIDRCGGTSSFDPAAPGGLLDSAFAGLVRHTLTSNDLLLTASAGGMDDLTKVHLRGYVSETRASAEHASATLPAPPFIISAGKGHLIYAPMDLTCGLLGVNHWGIVGYDPAYAESFVKNALIWTADGQLE